MFVFRKQTFAHFFALLLCLDTWFDFWLLVQIFSGVEAVQASRNVRVAATLEPSAAVNLEYLALALKDPIWGEWVGNAWNILDKSKRNRMESMKWATWQNAFDWQVRRQERREPLFSLDPVDPASMETTMQKKRILAVWAQTVLWSSNPRERSFLSCSNCLEPISIPVCHIIQFRSLCAPASALPAAILAIWVPM